MKENEPELGFPSLAAKLCQGKCPLSHAKVRRDFIRHAFAGLDRPVEITL